LLTIQDALDWNERNRLLCEDVQPKDKFMKLNKNQTRNMKIKKMWKPNKMRFQRDINALFN
jgi:hypothetical protein